MRKKCEVVNFLTYLLDTIFQYLYYVIKINIDNLSTNNLEKDSYNHFTTALAITLILWFKIIIYVI